MFKRTRNDYSMIRNSGISAFGSVLMTAFLFVTMPFVELWYWYKSKTDKNYQFINYEKDKDV